MNYLIKIFTRITRRTLPVTRYWLLAILLITGSWLPVSRYPSPVTKDALAQQTEQPTPEETIAEPTEPTPTPPPFPETPLQLTISPIPITLAAPPGTAASTPLRVKNDGSSPEHISVSVMTFGPDNATGRPQLREPTARDQFVDWVSFSESSFTIDPGQWKTITATFDIPPQAAFGYYYAIVFQRASQPDQSEPTAAKVVGGTAILVLLEAEVPNAIRSVEPLAFTVDKSWYEYLPVNFHISLQNNGNVHLAPRGNIFISKGSKKDIAILEVNQRQGNLLPNSRRDFTTYWADGFPVIEPIIKNGDTALDDQGHILYNTSWDFTQAHKLRIGRYTARMLLAYDDGQRDIPIEGEVSFWVIPWKLLVLIIGAVLLMIIGLYALLRPLLQRYRRSRRNPPPPSSPGPPAHPPTPPSSHRPANSYFRPYK